MGDTQPEEKPPEAAAEPSATEQAPEPEAEAIIEAPASEALATALAPEDVAPAPEAAAPPSALEDAAPAPAPAEDAQGEEPKAPPEGASGPAEAEQSGSKAEIVEQHKVEVTEPPHEKKSASAIHAEGVKSTTSQGVKSAKSGEKVSDKTSRVSATNVPSRTSSQVVKGQSSREVSKVHSSTSDTLDKRKSASEDLSREGPRKSRLTIKAQKAIGSTISIRRLSNIGDLYDKSKGARYMNTYKLDSDKPFNPEKVHKILETVMEEALANLTYDADNCPKQAKWASSAIRAKVKELEFDRYKLICLVTIGEKNAQDVFVACRFLWDSDRDRYASYSLENTYVFGIAQCFGLYYE